MGGDIFPVIWFGLIGFTIMMYITLDGFSLGIGILFPFIRDEKYRDVMMETASPVWDSNQTWLVLGAAGLYGAFPLAYAIILPAMYFPVIMMLLSLFLRGIAFEFRFKASGSRKGFDLALSGGSIMATFAQGLILGGIINGIATADQQYTGNVLNAFSLFGLFVGIALLMGYALQGAVWLAIKTEGDLQKRFYRMMKPLMMLVILAMIIVSVWTPLASDHVASRWFSYPYILWLSPVPLALVLLTWSVVRSINRRHEKLLFAKMTGLFLLGLGGLTISIFPLIIPPDITIWQAASHRSSQLFLLGGYAIFTPMILIYTFFSYRVFRGKVSEEDV